MPYEKYNLPDQFYRATNIADFMDDDVLDALGTSALTGVNTDINSRADWLERNENWMELVTQVMEEKTYPWPNASNVKFPLISTAAVQFHARAYPALLGHNRPVSARVIGQDPGNLKAERANRVSTLMSYQVTEGMDDWMEDMDRLLFIVPIIGSLYKKTYFSEQKNKSVSELVHPRDFIINYDAIDIKDARKTHRLWKLPNTIKEMQLRGLYRELDEEEYPIQASKQHSPAKDKAQGLNNPAKADDYSLQELFEVHLLLDLDDDGYKEPYILTIRGSDGKILRLVANYDDRDMEMIDEKLVAIHAKEFFTHYFFLPDPESKTHGIGFGTMIGPINEAVNTIINLLTDSGHLHSLGGGFLSRGVRLRGGDTKFKPNEWKVAQSTGDDLRKGIVPLPTKEPSMVLFQMLGMLIDSGKDLSSVQDQMVGRSPGQNQPFATTQAVMEQGMKVFNGIYKRLYRSMTREFKKLYDLNREFPDLTTYMHVLDKDGQDVQQAAGTPSPVTGQVPGISGVLKFLQADFEEDKLDIIPTAEPDMVAEMNKIMRSNSLMEKIGAGLPLNVNEVTKRVLEAEGHEDVNSLMEMPEQEPPFEVIQWKHEFAHQKEMDALEGQLKRIQTEADVNLKNMQGLLAMAGADEKRIEGLHAQWAEQQKQTTEEFKAVTDRLKVLSDAADRQRQATQPNKGDAGDS